MGDEERGDELPQRVHGAPGAGPQPLGPPPAPLTAWTPVTLAPPAPDRTTWMPRGRDVVSVVPRVSGALSWLLVLSRRAAHTAWMPRLCRSGCMVAATMLFGGRAPSIVEPAVLAA